MRIILVDDEQKFINMLAKRLIMRGIQADIVFTGDDAINKVKETTYDAAVLDLKMPGISGLQLKEELRNIDPDLKFVFVTGHGVMDKFEATEMQKDLYFSKPLDIETLIRQLNKIIKTG